MGSQDVSKIRVMGELASPQVGARGAADRRRDEVVVQLDAREADIFVELRLVARVR